MAGAPLKPDHPAPWRVENRILLGIYNQGADHAGFFVAGRVAVENVRARLGGRESDIVGSPALDVLEFDVELIDDEAVLKNALVGQHHVNGLAYFGRDRGRVVSEGIERIEVDGQRTGSWAGAAAARNQKKDYSQPEQNPQDRLAFHFYTPRFDIGGLG